MHLEKVVKSGVDLIEVITAQLARCFDKSRKFICKQTASVFENGVKTHERST